MCLCYFLPSCQVESCSLQNCSLTLIPTITQVCCPCLTMSDPRTHVSSELRMEWGDAWSKNRKRRVATESAFFLFCSRTERGCVGLYQRVKHTHLHLNIVDRNGLLSAVSLRAKGNNGSDGKMVIKGNMHWNHTLLVTPPQTQADAGFHSPICCSWSQSDMHVNHFLVHILTVLLQLICIARWRGLFA